VVVGEGGGLRVPLFDTEGVAAQGEAGSGRAFPLLLLPRSGDPG